VKIEFLGTRGYIDARSRRHRRHSSLMVSYYGTRIMIDCGEDWKGRLSALAPRALVITHTHPDLIYIKDRQAALSGVNIYIGDGATLV